MNNSVVKVLDRSSSFWSANGSFLLPGDINLRWEDYREIVQPDKASFWVMLGSLLLFITWIVFLTYYLSRVLGPIVAFFLTRLMKFKGCDVHISMGSFSLSLLSGKIMFRDFRWICQDFSLCCNDGWIIFSYWKFVPSKKFANKNDVSRLHLSLNGLQIHFYNRLSVYRILARQFGAEKLFTLIKDDSENKQRVLTRQQELEWDKYYDNLWNLLGYVKLDIASGRLLAGNAILPSMLVVSFENYTSKIFLKDYGKGPDRALLSVVAGTDNVRISLVKCNQFTKSKHLSNSAKYKPPPRTMGDGFAILQTAHLNFYYNQSILGVVNRGEQSLTEDLPVWESVWRLAKNTVFSYGPWADFQRVLLYDFFFPPQYQNTEVTVMPKEGQRRIFLAHDMRISLLNDAGIDIWFMRGEELNALHIRIKQGSSLDLKTPWVYGERGVETYLRCCLLFVESSTSLIYPKFLECETFRLTLHVHYPKVFNGFQKWDYLIEINKLRAWIVWDHKHFFTDLIDEWSSDFVPDLYRFVPYTWNFGIKVTDCFEVFLLLNNHNWVDTSSSTSVENELAAIVGERGTISFELPFTDFCAQKINTIYEIEATGKLGLRAWLSPRSRLSAALHSLLQNSALGHHAFKDDRLPTSSSLSQDWVEIYRCERISILLDFTYHTLFNDIVTDLPHPMKSTRSEVTHPIKLAPDDLSVEIEISESTVILTGILIKLIIELKNNYFGLYDQLSDITATENECSHTIYGDFSREIVECYRPLKMDLRMKISTINGFFPVYDSIDNQLLSDHCPEFTTDQLVLEIVKEPLGTMIQVVVREAAARFKEPHTPTAPDEHFILVNTFSFRGQGLFSELDVPWDAGTIEYSWITELIIGDIICKIDPQQLIFLVQIIESLILLSSSPDEELSTPEKYNMCVHMRDVRTCPISTLNLLDKKGRIQNCECEENVSIRQFIHINSKTGKRCLECGSIVINDVKLNIRLPSETIGAHLFSRKNFLTKHDDATKRLSFLWRRENKCACFGGSTFFGQDDIIGSFMMLDNNRRVAIVKIDSDIDVERSQPVIGESIIVVGESLFSSERLKWRSSIRKTSKTVWDVTKGIDSDQRSSSSESFHSAFSSTNIYLYHHMVSSILSSSILLESYATYLDVCTCDNLYLENRQDIFDKSLFRKECYGVNNLKLIKTQSPNKISDLSEQFMMVTSEHPDSENSQMFVVRANCGDELNLFISPLGVEALEHITEQVGLSLQSLHPGFIVENLYCSCVFKHHLQPLTKKLLEETVDCRSDRTKLDVMVAFPALNVAFFQCGLVEKTIRSTSLDDSMSQLAKSSVALLHFEQSVLELHDYHVKLMPVMKYSTSGHFQFLQLVESSKFDFSSSKSFSCGYKSNWCDLQKTNFEAIDLRAVIDFDLSKVTLSINEPIENNDIETGASQTNLISCHISPSNLVIGLCKPIDQTSRMEWPLFDVLAPCITSWIYAVHRLTDTIRKAMLKTNEWIDYLLIKLLSEVMDCNNDQIFAVEKSSFAEQKNYGLVGMSCPSCIFQTILLRYMALEDEGKPAMFCAIESSEMCSLLNENERKWAVIALLSHWQTIVCSHVKIADPETARKYLKHLLKNSSEVQLNIDSSVANNETHRKFGSNSANNSARSTADSGQMDLYHWIMSKHREHKESVAKNRVSKRLLESAPINTMEIILSVFFWPFYQARNLDPSGIRIVSLFEHFATEFSMLLEELKIDLIEPKMISASNVNYLSLARHHLIRVESLSMNGNLKTDVHLDELGLKVQRLCSVFVYHSMAQNVRAVFPLACVCLCNDLWRVVRSCNMQKTCKPPADVSSRSPLSITTIGTESAISAWIHRVLDKLGDYKRSRAGIARTRKGFIEIHVNGDLDVKIFMLEMTLTHLYVSVTMKKIRVLHQHTRSNVNDESKSLDILNLCMQRANLFLSEFSIGLDAKHIVSFSVKASLLKFERQQMLKLPVINRINAELGDVEGDMPIHAQNLHDVVLRNVSQINEQMIRLEYSPPTPAGEYSAHLHRRQAVAVIDFNVIVNCIELSAQLLPSLRIKYRLDGAVSSGITGVDSKFTGKIHGHVVQLMVIPRADQERRPSVVLNLDAFTLALPQICADGAYRQSHEQSGHIADDDNLQFRAGGYIDVVLTIGKLEHTFSTDLLNQVLFAEQCFRAELTSFIERVIGDRLPRPSTVTEQSHLPHNDPFLFTISIRGESAPWFQLTASTPTAIAFRLTFDNISATLTNRWTQKGVKSKTERLYGKAIIGVSAKLGQLVKTAMFEEIETELQEVATFMTQITLHNKNSRVSSSYSYVVIVNRAIFLIKSSAIDKAILLWLNYKNTYDFWREEKTKMLKSSGEFTLPSTHIASPMNMESEMNVDLSLKVTNGVYVCMPLYSADLSENLSALLVSLQSTDISVCVRKELACHATFHNFKVKFIDNFDDQALNDTWIENEPSDPSRSNYFYFPQGTYQFVSRADAARNSTENAKWTLSVKWQMLGMIIDLDHRIGKLMSLLISTFSSLTSDSISEEEWIGSMQDFSVIDEDLGSSNRDDTDPEIDETGEFGNLAQDEERIQWLERKMHEQSVLVTDLIQCGASEPAIEKERRTLRKLESARFRQFRKSMLDKLRRNAARQRRKLLQPKKSDDLCHSKKASQVSKDDKTESSSRSNKLAGVERNISQKTDADSISTVSPADTVDMNIDIQISIESGECSLRTPSHQNETGVMINKRPSARDLRSKMAQSVDNVAVTKLAIPSVDVRAYYTSSDTILPKSPPLLAKMAHVHRSLKSNQKRRPAFYLIAELASMPQESLITPHLAEFLEQMLETIPGTSLGSTIGVPETHQVELDDADVPIVEMDTSAIPLDVLLHLTVQSSTIRFEGQQQRTAAADCLLKLPSLALTASTRPFSELSESEVADCGTTIGGIHVSATLSAFSLNIYSPHQHSTAHDALLLTLDHLSILASRSKNNRNEPDNKVQFVMTATIGSANFNYDMRRLAELISFPKPWYRRNIVRRLFFGDHSVKMHANATEPSPVLSRESPGPTLMHSSTICEANKRKEWSATVIFAVEWKELKINAQMANAMGNTKLFVREGVLRGYCQLNSKLDKIVSINFRLNSAVLSAHGGAVSGEIMVNVPQMLCRYHTTASKPPRNYVKIDLNEFGCRIEWMSRPIFIAKCVKPSVTLFDDWTCVYDHEGEVLKSSVSVNLTCTWSDLQLIITKVTVDDIVKIAKKLQSFFQEQLNSSRMVWGLRNGAMLDHASAEEVDTQSVKFTKYRHWQSVLDTLTSIQTRQKLLPIPRGTEGVTVVGGILELSGENFSLACMHGEMNATSWALFHMRNPSVLFVPEAHYAFISDERDVGVLISQRLNIKLSNLPPHQDATERMAVVCRVQFSRGNVVRQMSSISACLQHIIGDVLVQIGMQSRMNKESAGGHSVLQLFQFPALDAVLSTQQKQEIDMDEELLIPEVRSSFICEFHDSVNVQTDFNAQVSFLPELIKTYIKSKTQEEKAVDLNRDFRHYICEHWSVDPKIRFIDRFKWNPPVIDEILRKLQIFDHRTTIPKALQRGLLDPCDALLARMNFAILLIAEKSLKYSHD